jgi:NAD(P)H-hydrate repair Nnr-like enzyme with NAD(P)H-hydrate epimerase domain
MLVMERRERERGGDGSKVGMVRHERDAKALAGPGNNGGEGIMMAL